VWGINVLLVFRKFHSSSVFINFFMWLLCFSDAVFFMRHAEDDWSIVSTVWLASQLLCRWGPVRHLQQHHHHLHQHRGVLITVHVTTICKLLGPCRWSSMKHVSNWLSNTWRTCETLQLLGYGLQYYCTFYMCEKYLLTYCTLSYCLGLEVGLFLSHGISSPVATNWWVTSWSNPCLLGASCQFLC